ncbi:MAG: endolytic transglycosylase MltG [candidate division WOR-3 bacterium]
MRFLFLASSFFVFFLQIILYSPLFNLKGKEEKVFVRYRESISEFSKKLKEKGIISHEKFIYFMKIYNPEFKLYAGEWKIINSGNSFLNFKNIDNAEKNFELIITIPEGYELRKILKLLSEKGGYDYDELNRLAQNPENFKELFEYGVPQNLEGYLFPDTYILSYSLSEKEVLEIFIKRFFEVIKELGYDTIKDRLELSLEEILTLASIIEKEAIFDYEKKIISSVYYNRLKKGIPLQADPTIQYLLPKPLFPLPLRFLKMDSPYNTYKNKGLPPTPICSPGKKSIEAALYPEKTEYLYFVARGDGTHIFSKTYEEHLKNKRSAKKEWIRRGLLK